MPVANALNMSSAGIPTMSTAGVYTASTPTQYNVQVGGASNLLASVAPSATSGIPLISNGASANPSFSTAVVAGGGTGLTTTTAYAVLCGGTTTTGALQSIASVGTAAQVLTSNGAGALPTFQAAAAGGAAGWTLISTATASASASLVFTSSINSTYNMYALVFDQLLPSTDSNGARLKISTDGGSTYKSADYVNAAFYSTATSVNSINAAGYIVLCRESFWRTGAMGICGVIYIVNPSAAQRIGLFGQTITSNLLISCTIFGAYDFSGAVNALEITATTGNIASGTVKLYGISKP